MICFDKKIIGWVDLRKTPEGYKGVFDENGWCIIYCPYMPVFEGDEEYLKLWNEKDTIG